MKTLLLRIVGGYLTYFLAIGVVFGGIAVLGAGDAVTNDPVGRMVAQLVLMVVASSLMVIYAQRWGGVPMQCISFALHGRNLLFAAVIALATVALAWIYMLVLGGVVGHAYSVVSPSLTVLLIGIVGEFGALHEEVESRGYFLTLLAQPYGVALAILGSSLLFMLGHIPFKGINWMLIANFMGGIGFAYLYIKSGSLWPSVIVHAAHNLATDLFLTGNNEGVSVGIGLFHFTSKLTAPQRLPYDFLLMLLMIGLAYVFYGWDTRFFEPAPRLRQRWQGPITTRERSRRQEASA